MNLQVSTKAYQRNRFFAIILSIVIVSLFSAGCNKDDDGSSSGGNDYYMKFSINGIMKEYKGNTLAEFTEPGYEASMVALKDALDPSASTMSIVLYSDNPFKTNTTYSEAFNATGYPGASLVYFDELGNVFTSLNTTLATDTKVSVTFTAIADGYVKGTFSGKLYEEAFEPAVYTITNGSFYLKRE